MGLIKVKFPDGNNIFSVESPEAEQIENVKISNKSVSFDKSVSEDGCTEISLNLDEVFPSGIFFNLTFFDLEEHKINIKTNTEGIGSFFGAVQGVFKLENNQVQLKFLHFNDLFEQVVDAPILQVKNLYDYTNQALNRKAIDDSSELLVISIQEDTSVNHIVPLTYEKDKIFISTKYLTGLFDIKVILLKNEHIFLISPTFTVTNEDCIFISQTQKYLGAWDNEIKYESTKEGQLSFHVEGDTDIKQILLLTDNMLAELHRVDVSKTFLVSNFLSENMRTAYLLLQNSQGFYIKNLEGIIINGEKIASYFVDITKYNFNKNHLKNTVPLSVKNIAIKGTTLQFSLDTEESYIESETPFLLIKQRNKGMIYYIHGTRLDTDLYFDFYYLLEEFENKNGLRWDIYLINDPKSTVSYQLGLFTETILKKPKRFFPPFKQEFENNSTYKRYTRVYITVNNELALVKNNISNLIKEEFKLKPKVVDFTMKRNIVNLQIDVISPYIQDIKLDSLQLIQRNKDSLNVRNFPIKQNNTSIGKKTIESTINLETANLGPLYWDLYVTIISNGKPLFVKVSSIKKEIGWDINQTISKYQYSINNTNIIYPYITLSNELSFTYREREFYENRYYLLKENLAYLFVQLFYKNFSKREIWLAFEKLAVSAHDSGYYFFDYVYKNKKHDDFYYIIQKDSPELKNLADKKDKVVYFMSFKYFVYMFAAKLLVSSDTKRNSYNLKLKKSKLAKVLTNKNLVYLQHGVNGLKRVPDFHKNRGVFDLVIAPSEFEKQMITEKWGYDETEVAVTGLARWDGLVDKTDEVSYRQIFLMPTWRTWMDSMDREQFVESEYFQKYNELLSSERLHKLLEEYNVKIKFFLHPKFRDYIDLFDSKSPNIEKFGFLETSIDEMIMKSSLMISDYSSVIWEMFYLKKPCVFFHFDKNKYLEYEGSYMNFDTDLFGDVAYKTSDLIDIIEGYIQNGFKEKNKYAKMRNDYFTFMDKHNSERIYEAIEENRDWLINDSLKIPKFKVSHLVPYGVRRKLLNWKRKILT